MKSTCETEIEKFIELSGKFVYLFNFNPGFKRDGEFTDIYFYLFEFPPFLNKE